MAHVTTTEDCGLVATRHHRCTPVTATVTYQRTTSIVAAALTVNNLTTLQQH